LYGGNTLKKLAICALALGGLTFTSGAYAADLSLDGLKDPLPQGPLTWAGLTLYGQIDAGVAYQSHGAPSSGALSTGLEYNIVGSNNLHVNNLWAVSPNGLSQSFVGLKMEEALGAGWTAVGKIESGFVPTSGELADGCASLSRNNGLANTVSGAKGDSSRCGQLFNGPAYVGVSNAAYGTLTFGRQNSLLLDDTAAYDPQRLSYAFSLLGYSGGTDGTGDTETARWDDSVKYVYQYGPFHAAGMYTQGGPDTSFGGPAWGANVGAIYKGASVDFVYDNAHSAIASSSMTLAQCAAIGLTQPACAGQKILAGTISDNTVAAVMGRYTYELGGGYKDMDPAAKLTFYGGYERATFNDPSGGVPVGYTAIGGYVMGAVNNANFKTEKDLDIYWVGVSYETGAWRFTAAYYGESQNSWLKGTIGGPGTPCTGVGTAAVASNCAGKLNTVSFVVDYEITKHFDWYAGVEYSDANGGFISGFAPNSDNVTTVMSGVRLRF
jgi:predicted porin